MKLSQQILAALSSLIIISACGCRSDEALADKRLELTKEIALIESILKADLETHGRLPKSIETDSRLKDLGVDLSRWNYQPNDQKYIVVGTSPFVGGDGKMYVYVLSLDMNVEIRPYQ